MRRSFSLSGMAAVLVLGVLALPATGAQAEAPQPPPSLTVVDSSAAGFTLSWQPSPSTDLTGYQVQWSQDGAETWQDVSGGFTASTQYPVTAPPAGHTVQYRVVARNADGDSDPTSDIDTYTPGNVAQTFTVRMPDGTPVTGENGEVQWSDGYGTWNRGPDLNPHGVVTLPSVPAGTDELIEIDGSIGDNEYVNKTYSVDFGTEAQTLIVPPPPPMISDRVTVTMPGGVPAVGVEVNAWYYEALDEFNQTDGFTYSDDNALWFARTDADGVAVVKGWSTAGVDFEPAPKYPYPEQAVDLDYNDGVLHSESVGMLTGTDTALQIDPLPYTTTTDPSTVPIGDTATAEFQIHPAPSSGSTGAPAAAKSLAGVHVTLVPPKTWSAGACTKKSALTGTSNSAGYVKLPVCAIQLTRFKVRTQGALPTVPITVTARKSVPGAPSTVRADSPARGELRVAWTKAVYTGGARVSGYRVTATSTGRRTVTWAAPAAGHSHTFDRLARSAAWTVTVSAVNARGAGHARSARTKVR